MVKVFILIGLMTLATYSYAQQLSITSNPVEVDIYVRDLSENTTSLIGKTPVKMDITEAIAKYSKKNGIVIIAQKRGYKNKEVILPDLGNTDAQLVVDLELDGSIEFMIKIDKLIGQLFEGQRLIRAKQYSEAVTYLEALQKDFPAISTIPELIAGAHYLNKDFRSSLNYYNKALELNTDNEIAFKMKNLLEESLGISNKDKAGNK